MTTRTTSLTRGFTLATVAVALAVSGCANMSETQQDSAKGAGIGAAAGAVLGALTGGSKAPRAARSSAPAPVRWAATSGRPACRNRSARWRPPPQAPVSA